MFGGEGAGWEVIDLKQSQEGPRGWTFLLSRRWSFHFAAGHCGLRSRCSRGRGTGNQHTWGVHQPRSLSNSIKIIIPHLGARCGGPLCDVTRITLGCR